MLPDGRILKSDALEEGVVQPKEQAISELAGKVADEVARLAESLDRAVGPPPGVDEG